MVRVESNVFSFELLQKVDADPIIPVAFVDTLRSGARFFNDGEIIIDMAVFVLGLGSASDADGLHPGDEEGDAADEANECCVCFDRRINTRLQPCGHVALCHACAARLTSSRCPLCRAQIVDVLRV